MPKRIVNKKVLKKAGKKIAAIGLIGVLGLGAGKAHSYAKSGIEIEKEKARKQEMQKFVERAKKIEKKAEEKERTLYKNPNFGVFLRNLQRGKMKVFQKETGKTIMLYFRSKPGEFEKKWSEHEKVFEEIEKRFEKKYKKEFISEKESIDPKRLKELGFTEEETWKILKLETYIQHHLEYYEYLEE